MQQDNLDFFLLVGAGLHSAVPGPAATDFIIVISGDTCSPCQMVLPQMHTVPDADLPSNVKAAWTDQVSDVVLFQAALAQRQSVKVYCRAQG